MKRIKLQVGDWTGYITAQQLSEVLFVAGNGYGNGDFYENGSFGGKRAENMFFRGCNVLNDALEAAGAERVVNVE